MRGLVIAVAVIVGTVGAAGQVLRRKCNHAVYAAWLILTVVAWTIAAVLAP